MSKEDFYKQKTHPRLIQPNEDHPIPKTIGPYQIEGLLDTGGMSYLYLANDPDSKEPLVIKVLSQKWISNPEVVKRFLNEAEIIAMANHPNIIKMSGQGEWEEGLYIAMEYVDGVSLRQYLMLTPLSLKTALKLILDIAYALCHLHTHGVIHRDLKPENILITESGEIKVIDFGIAQLITEDKKEMSPEKKRLIGTPIYISPEQKDNPENVSFPSDIYSLGIIAYELILGKLSFGHIHLSLMPQGIHAILNKCLQPNPNDRYQDIVDFITDLSNYMHSSAMEKEKVFGDQLSEIAEEILQLQSSLNPSAPPPWKDLKMGIASYKGFDISGLYFDFFELEDKAFTVVFGETTSTGAESLRQNAVFRGMVHTLFRLIKDPKELVETLNQILIEEHLSPYFNFNFIIFKPKEQAIHYLTTSENNLWMIKAGSGEPLKLSANPLVLGLNTGQQFPFQKEPWKSGDTLIINNISLSTKENPLVGDIEEDVFVKKIQDILNLDPQQLSENLLRKIRLNFKARVQEKPLTVLTVRAL